MKEIKKGQKYWYKWAHSVGFNELRIEKVVEVITLGNGEVLIRHQEPPLWGFLSYPVEDTPLREFLDNSELLP